MKKIIYAILLILFVLFCLKSCIRADIAEDTQNVTVPQNEDIKFYYPNEGKTVEIEGVEYLQTTVPIGTYGGELVLSTIGEGPKTFNPFNSKDATSSQLAGLMFDGLFTIHPISGQTVPLLAKSYEINGLDYIVHLRKGVEWSDGNLITADDVVFTWNDIIFAGLGNTSTRDSIIIDGKLPNVQKLDDYTVKFTIPKPFAPFLNTLSTPIAPQHVFKSAVEKGAKYFESFYSTTTAPEDFVTSGPFKLKEYVPAQRVIFEKNNNYYKVDKNNQKLPYLDELIYLIVGDLNNEILKFEAKEIDVISLRGNSVGRYKQMEPKSNFKIYNLGPDTGTMFLAFNLNDRKNSNGNFYVKPEKQKWLKDKNFRTAIDYAVDRKNMIQNVANGLGAPLYTAESLNSIYLNKNLPSYEKNLNHAKQLLKNSGFYTDENGKLYDKNHVRVELDLFTNAGNTEREALGVMIKQDLEELGIQVNFKPIEFNSLVNKLVNTLDWDMTIMGLTGSPLEPNNGKNVWYSTGSLHMFNQRFPNEGKKNILPWEQSLDEIFDKAALEIDFDKRKSYYDKYQTIVYNEKPFVYLYSPTRIYAIRNKFKNIFPSPLSGLIYNLDEIYTEEK